MTGAVSLWGGASTGVGSDPAELKDLERERFG